MISRVPGASPVTATKEYLQKLVDEAEEARDLKSQEEQDKPIELSIELEKLPEFE